MKIDIQQFDNIIFDFGGVIMDINPEITANGFKAIGGEEGMKKMDASDVLWQFERGEISSTEIHKQMQHYLNATIPETEFQKIWCALLLKYEPKRIDWIIKLSKTHKLFMLSNTNEIHFNYFSQKFINEYGISFYELFSEVYLSYKMGLLKPSKSIYKQVLEEQHLIPEKTLFIEDTKDNIGTAAELGIQTLLIPRNSNFYAFFDANPKNASFF